jgi:hypothetical protein
MTNRHEPVLMPSEVSSRVGPFDRFAGVSSMIASRAVFFTVCVILILVWAPTYFLIQNVDTWQLIINTITTIITFLMVALLQNSPDPERSGDPAQAQRHRRRTRRPHDAHPQLHPGSSSASTSPS